MSNLFELALEAYLANNKTVMNARIRNWFAAKEPNPFTDNEELADLYENATILFKRAYSDAIDARHAYKWMLIGGAKILKLYTEEQTKPANVSPAVTDYKVVTLDVPEHVLGVVPENNAQNSFQKKAKDK